MISRFTLPFVGASTLLGQLAGNVQSNTHTDRPLLENIVLGDISHKKDSTAVRFNPLYDSQIPNTLNKIVPDSGSLQTAQRSYEFWSSDFSTHYWSKGCKEFISNKEYVAMSDAAPLGKKTDRTILIRYTSVNTICYPFLSTNTVLENFKPFLDEESMTCVLRSSLRKVNILNIDILWGLLSDSLKPQSELVERSINFDFTYPLVPEVSVRSINLEFSCIQDLSQSKILRLNKLLSLTYHVLQRNGVSIAENSEIPVFKKEQEILTHFNSVIYNQLLTISPDVTHSESMNILMDALEIFVESEQSKAHSNVDGLLNIIIYMLFFLVKVKIIKTLDQVRLNIFDGALVSAKNYLLGTDNLPNPEGRQTVFLPILERVDEDLDIGPRFLDVAIEQERPFVWMIRVEAENAEHIIRPNINM